MSGQGGGPPVVGVDLGGTKVLAAVVDGGNQILGRSKVPTPAKEGGPAILRAMAGAVREALDEARVPVGQVGGVGVGSPGPLDTARGVVLFSVNLNVRDYPLAPELAVELGRPVLLQNDVRVGTYGEFRLGAGRGYRDVLAAFVGTGIGGGLIFDGKMVLGATGNAGEIGHMPVKAGGPKCGCGQEGCLEALASRSAITRRIAKAVKEGESTSLAHIRSKADKLKSKDLAFAFHAGDAVAVREVRRAAHYLGLALGGLINAFGPEVVILGGGVTEALGEPYLELVRAAARPQALTDPDGTIPIVPAALGDDAGVLGAALLAREAFGTS